MPPPRCLLRKLRARGMWETGRGNGEGRWTEDIEAAHFNNRNNPSLYFKHFFFFFGFLSAAPFGLRDLSSLARD